MKTHQRGTRIERNGDLTTRALRAAADVHLAGQTLRKLTRWMNARHITPTQCIVHADEPYMASARVDNRWEFELNGIISVECRICGWVEQLSDESESELLVKLGHHVMKCTLQET